jgi:flagellar M-ring protein FliF
VNQFLEQLKNLYSSLSLVQKTSIPVVFFLSVAGFIGFLLWAQQDTHKLVFQSTDFSRVEDARIALDKANIPYSLTEDGTKIYSPNTYIGQARIVAASTNSIAGVEVLESIEIGVSPNMEKTMKNIAREGELSKTINALEMIEASRVHIVEPESSPFLSRQSEGSASVVLWLAENSGNGQGFTRPNSDQLKGIASLVAAAVRGLTPNKVVIVDQEGNLLRGYLQNEDPNIASSTSLLELKRLEEKQYAQSIKDLLSGIVKGNNVKVAVTVDLVRETKESSVQSYDPTQQVTISEKINESASTERDSAGIPGSESNLPEQAPNSDEGSVSEKFQSAVNYDYTKTVETSLLPPGSVRNVSVSVVVNSLMLEELANNSNGASSVEDLKTQIQESVRHAIGFNKDRGDQAKISFIPFAPISKPEGSDTPQVVSVLGDFLPYIIMLVAILLFFFVLVRPLVTSITTALGNEDDPYAGLSEDEKQLLEVSTADGNTAMTNRIRRMIEGFEPIDARDLNKLVDMNEEPSAEVLRRWIRIS